MAPEVLAARWLNGADYPSYTETCDIWSLGMLFVEFLCGYNPMWKKVCSLLAERSES